MTLDWVPTAVNLAAALAAVMSAWVAGQKAMGVSREEARLRTVGELRLRLFVEMSTSAVRTLGVLGEIHEELKGYGVIPPSDKRLGAALETLPSVGLFLPPELDAHFQRVLDAENAFSSADAISGHSMATMTAASELVTQIHDFRVAFGRWKAQAYREVSEAK